MSAKTHAILSASSAYRWINCPPSARLCENLPDKPSEYAEEGTQAHVLCEYKLRKYLNENVKDPTKNLSKYNSEMEESAEFYLHFASSFVEVAKKILRMQKFLSSSEWIFQIMCLKVSARRIVLLSEKKICSSSISNTAKA